MQLHPDSCVLEYTTEYRGKIHLLLTFCCLAEGIVFQRLLLEWQSIPEGTHCICKVKFVLQPFDIPLYQLWRSQIYRHQSTSYFCAINITCNARNLEMKWLCNGWHIGAIKWMKRVQCIAFTLSQTKVIFYLKKKKCVCVCAFFQLCLPLYNRKTFMNSQRLFITIHTKCVHRQSRLKWLLNCFRLSKCTAPNHIFCWCEMSNQPHSHSLVPYYMWL